MSYDILDAPLGEDHKIIREKATLLKKIQSIFIDYIVFTVLSMLTCIIPILLSIVFILLAVDAIMYSFIFIYLLIVPIGATIIALFLIKDVLNSASFGKQRSGLLVIDLKTNLPASELKCILRHITLLFWPIECLLSLVNPSRRLGDYLMGTAVMQTTPLTFTEIREQFRQRERGKLLKYWGAVTFIILSFMSLLVFS